MTAFCGMTDREPFGSREPFGRDGLQADREPFGSAAQSYLTMGFEPPGSSRRRGAPLFAPGRRGGLLTPRDKHRIVDRRGADFD